jgi:hypothetical protein
MSMRVRGAAELEAGANWDDPAMFAEPVRDEAAQTDRRATRQAKQAGLEGMS